MRRRQRDWRNISPVTVQDNDRRRHGSRPLSRDAPALTGSHRGQVQVMFGNMPSSIEHLEWQARPLAVTKAARSEACRPATCGDFVPAYEASTCRAFGAPGNTPAEIVDNLNKEINAALSDPKIKARLADLGAPCLAARPPISEGSSPTKPRNGAR